MVRLNSGKSWMKSAELASGDMLEFASGGEWVESSQYTYDDGTPRKQFVIKVKFKGEEKDMSLNKMSRDNLMDGFGDETEMWIGQTAQVEKVKVMVAGQMRDSIILHPKKNGDTPQPNLPEGFGMVEEDGDEPF